MLRTRLPTSSGAPRALRAIAATILCCGSVTLWAADNVGKVVRVVDGRTLVVRIERRKVTVRLLGVETPARASLFTQYLTFGRHVALEREPGSPDRDERGRLFRNVHLDDGTFLNAELVKRGYATPDTELPCSHAEAFEAFDRHAREEALGQYTGTVSPIVLEPGVAEVRPGLYMSGIDGTGQPTLIPGTKIRPIYPQMARRTGGWERVVLQAVVRKDGTVGDICILSAPPGGIGFEESAVAAVSRWRYEPALKDGRPVDVVYGIVIDFSG